jgi:hypothetical protein
MMLNVLKNILKSAILTKTEEITVTLPELSTVWLKYNQNFQPQKSDELTVTETGQDQALRPSVHSEIQDVDNIYVLQRPKIKSTDFCNDIIEPHRDLLTQQDVLEGIYKIIELLDEHGGCPSIVTTSIDKDSETDEIYSIRDTLLKVSLKDHSYRVTKIALKLLKETYREKDYENLIPKMIVTALGHDFGKIPALRESGLYAKADHPLISAQKVNEIFMGKDIIWLNSAVDAIKNHHRQTNDPFSLLLKEADGKAREREVSECSKDISIKEWDEWFNVQSFLEILRPQINVIQTGKKWKAFSFGGTVYCQPDFLYEAARKLASEGKVIDMTLLRVSEKERALKKIVDSLKRANVVGNELGEDYYGMFYEIQMDKAKRKMFLTPLKIDAFGMPSEIERVKEGYLQVIRSVIPGKK